MLSENDTQFPVPAGSNSSYAPGGQCANRIGTAQGFEYCGRNGQIFGYENNKAYFPQSCVKAKLKCAR